MRGIPALIALAGAVSIAGCSKELDPPVDKDQALEQLRLVLQTWKSNEPPDVLEKRSPKVVFHEPLWQQGNSLLEFEIGDIELFGRQGRCTVKLFLQDKDGKRFERKIGYQIDTTPFTTIVRESLGP